MSLTPSVLTGIGWKASGDFRPQESRKPFFPRIRQAIGMIPLLIRLCIFVLGEWFKGRGVFINLFSQMKHYPYTGVPCGGIGSGSIGTDFRGAFNKYSLIPGIKEQNTSNIKANQFIITVKTMDGSTIFHSLLTCADFKSGHLKTWKTSFEKKNMRYRGLFPRAWREFTIPDLGLAIIQEQMSPVIPNNYEDSSFPLSVFNYTVINNSANDYDVSLTFTFRNGTGNKQWDRESVCTSSAFKTTNSYGIKLEHAIRQLPVTYSLSVETAKGVSVTWKSFDPNGDGSEVWNSLEQDGRLETSDSSKSANELGIAVCSSFISSGNRSMDTSFCLCWDMPNIEFGLETRSYRRRYTAFTGDADASEILMQIAFEKRSEWNRAIEDWQRPVLEDESLPVWYRSALFNELYYVVDGATAWVVYDEKWIEKEHQMSTHSRQWMDKYGRFAYMESWEYYMYNTYDVHFYASWALLKNWPALEMGIQLDFCDQIYRKDDKEGQSMCEGEKMVVKTYGRTPHDLGHPLGEPWIDTNAYLLHDTAHWRDLNLKFVPMCWRDWTRIYRNETDIDESRSCLLFMFERCRFIVDCALRDWDSDGDGVIENGGTADQTYDMWTMTGTSAYCGSLWLCAVWCLVEMAEELKDEQSQTKYSKLLAQAKESFVKKLWNGRHFKFDENPCNSKTVMADQLCGVWCQSMFQGKEQLISEDMVKSALSQVYSLNVQSFAGGSLGPVNGITEDGTMDVSSIQSEEVWTGTAYALASFMIMKGMREEGFSTAGAMFEACWSRFGMQYQTPEAIYKKHYYRAIGYMRPLSVWAIQDVLESEAKIDI